VPAPALAPERIGRRSTSAGFTLVETVVLIVILGIVAVSVAPRFVSVTDMDGSRAHTQARDDLRYARQLAATSGCPIQVDFTATGYVLTQRNACRSGAFSRAVVDPVTNAGTFAITVPSGVAVSSSVDPLVFDALGRATNASGTPTTANIRIAGRPLEAVGETGLIRVP